MTLKKTTIFTCTNCSYQSTKWLGKCSDCGEWNSFVEEAFSKKEKNTKKKQTDRNQSKQLSQIKLSNTFRVKTKNQEFDRVVGGGLVPGSLTLIGGEPGVGKSTLLLDIMSRLSSLNIEDNILYVSGEESEEQIATRADRVGITNQNFLILHETNWQNILEEIKSLKPRYIVLDSIQTTISSEVGSTPGSISQIKEVTYELMNIAKAQNITCFVVGHINKEGAIAGPKILEHMVDTVIYFEGDRSGQFRILRTIKNRFGNTNEIGIFEMYENGLREVKNPSQCFVGDFQNRAAGRSLSCIRNGSRNIFLELQSLVNECKYAPIKPVASGIDSNRMSMLLAVIEKYLNHPIGLSDIYLNIVGNLKMPTRDTDLAIIASLLSSYKAKPLLNKTVYIGEVGLTGEIRSVNHLSAIIKEMEYLEYENLIICEKQARELNEATKLNIIGIKHIKDLAKII